MRRLVEEVPSHTRFGSAKHRVLAAHTAHLLTVYVVPVFPPAEVCVVEAGERGPLVAGRARFRVRTTAVPGYSMGRATDAFTSSPVFTATTADWETRLLGAAAI